MPRRNSHRKASKRHRKGSPHRRDVSGNKNSEQLVTTSTSLEEDLRQQRIRQQERQKRREMERDEKKENNHGILDKDEGCNHDVGYQQPRESDGTIAATIRKAHHLILKGRVSPESLAPLRRDVKNKENNSNRTTSLFSLSASVIRLPPSFLLWHVEQTSTLLAMRKRNALRKLWVAQHHLEMMTIQPRAASLYSKTKWPTCEYSNNLKCPWDLSCKHRLHPSARTFDVAMLDDSTDLSWSSTPTIATIFQDGWGLLRQKSQHKINTIKAPPAYAIRMHESSRTCGMIIRPDQNSSHRHMSQYSFRWYPLPHATSYVEASLPHAVTDFCFGNEIALFSCPQYSRLSSMGSLKPLFLPLVEAGGMGPNTYHNSPVRTIDVQNFPVSDALRIEMMCKHQEKLLGFGHRNGLVSILDLRAPQTLCSILQCENKTAGKHLGSATDLAFPSVGYGHRHEVLVKRSFGSYQLHDLRKSTSVLSDGAADHTSTTVVHNMMVPPNEINATLSANCNGFFIDPNSRQTMMSPYIDNPSGDARLGVWSLDTGLFIGSRLLLENKHGSNAEDESLHVEVCSKISPLVVSNRQSVTGSDGLSSSSSSSSYGVWLKCGAFTTQRLPSKVGSLHQLSIPGRWNEDDTKINRRAISGRNGTTTMYDETSMDTT
mmetsp:Transcript_27701/g.65045  ORF Transcript_27701/g.65045 Transcript_27701/m.65045 type:complete len:658 (+) Transcript_27701:93-2066(+)